MADAALTFLLQQVMEVLKDYRDLQNGAGYELNELKESLLLFNAFLKDSANSKKKEVFKEKEKKIRELVYDMEDIIDTCLTKTAAAKNKNTFNRFFTKLMNPGGMAQQVKLFRQQKVKPIVDQIYADFRKPPMDDMLDEGSTRQLPSTVTDDQATWQTGSQDESDSRPEKDGRFVDFNEEATIVGYLKESKQGLHVISICGMAGLGKTTLAWKIFENGEIRSRFPLRIWIRVSRKFNIREVFLNILRRLVDGDWSSRSNEELIPTIRSRLSTREFLLVMDDVWNVEDWNKIEEILPKNNGKGKVLVTTRTHDVAHQQDDLYRKTINLKQLDSWKCLELLKMKVYGSCDAFPEELENEGQAIANKCNGVPLIIVVIGGVLKRIVASTQGFPVIKDKWKKVLENMKSIIFKDRDRSIKNALEMSYNELPDDLGMCFLYAGLFPEDHEIPASTLTQLWIAEGFIHDEDKAERNLDALVNMNLLTVAKKSFNQIKTCGVHDMVRGFCEDKAKELNLFTVMKTTNASSSNPDHLPIRRLCLHSNLESFVTQEYPWRVRSFLCFFNEARDLDPKHPSSTIPHAFNMLRVLNCKSIKFQEFPQVTKLMLLKHITVFVNNLDVLPKELSKLINLQTLIVETNSRSIKVKANIWKMIQLRRLKAKAAISLNKKKWEVGRACKNLQAISRLSPDSCVAALSKRAPNLKKLGIKGKLTDSSSNFSLEGFHRLEKLKLVNDSARESECHLALLPQHGVFLRQLKIKMLTLSKTYLHWDSGMPTLAQIVTLKVLKLKNDAFIGAFWEANGNHTFHLLQFLLIENSELVIWNASTTHFPKLTCLVLKKCKQLEKIPEDIGGGNLVKLEIQGVKKSAADSARKIESNQKKGKQSQDAQLGAPFQLTVGPECDL